MLRPTAISVTVQKDYTLKVIFNNGETKIFDVKPYIKGSWYSRLKDFSYFSLAKADRFTVIWGTVNSFAQISSDILAEV